MQTTGRPAHLSYDAACRMAPTMLPPASVLDSSLQFVRSAKKWTMRRNGTRPHARPGARNCDPQKNTTKSEAVACTTRADSRLRRTWGPRPRADAPPPRLRPTRRPLQRARGWRPGTACERRGTLSDLAWIDRAVLHRWIEAPLTVPLHRSRTLDSHRLQIQLAAKHGRERVGRQRLVGKLIRADLSRAGSHGAHPRADRNLGLHLTEQLHLAAQLILLLGRSGVGRRPAHGMLRHLRKGEGATGQRETVSRRPIAHAARCSNPARSHSPKTSAISSARTAGRCQLCAEN